MDAFKITVHKVHKCINIKVTDMERKIGTVEAKMVGVGSSCSFINDESETQRKNVNDAKTDIKTLQQQCNSFAETADSFHRDKEKINEKLTDLESRSMRDNLIFMAYRKEERMKTVVN